MKRMRGILLALSMMLVACSLVFGAGAKEVTQTGVVELDFWSVLTGSQAAVLNSQVDRFNASQDKVKVTVIAQGGYAELQQKLLASISAGTTPVLTMVDYMFVPFYASQGVFENLDPYMNPVDKKDFIQGLLDDLTFKGGLYAVPYNRSTQGFYYNKDLYRKAGLGDSAPKTWEQYREFALKIRNLGSQFYGGYAYFNRWYFEPIIQQWGGRVNDEQGNVKINEPETVAALRFFQDIYLKDKAVMMQPTISGGFEEQNLDYAEGYVGSTLQSTSWLTRMADRVNFDWDFAFLPAGPAGNVVTNGGANIAIVARATKAQKEAAWTFLQFMTSTNETARLHVETGYMPVRHSALNLPEVKAFHEQYPRFRVSIDQLAFAKPTSIVAKNVLEYNSVIDQLLQKIMIVGVDPQIALDEAAKALQRSIDEMRAEGRLVL
jgi:sn-glycerol 3-phosphate transport system substrate-binding protein